MGSTKASTYGTQGSPVVGLVILCLLCSQGSALLAQDTSAVARVPLSIGLHAHSGFIVPHSKELIDVSGSRPLGLELDLSWTYAAPSHTRTLGMAARKGIALHAVDFNNGPVLGRMLGLSPYVEPVVRVQDRLHGSIRLGLGLAWLSRVYDAETNPTNLFFSSRVSFLALVNASLAYRVNLHWTAVGGFHFNHISNGGMKEPNKGMNFPTFSLGAAYTPKPLAPQRPARDNGWKSQRKRTSYALLSGSVKTLPLELGNTTRERGWLLGAIAITSWRMGRLTALSAGTEWVHDGYSSAMLQGEANPISAWKGALLVGPELVVGPVRCGLLLGGYAFNPSRRTDAIYQRYQLLYSLSKHLVVGTSLKAHRHVADVFDLRLGWSW